MVEIHPRYIEIGRQVQKYLEKSKIREQFDMFFLEYNTSSNIVRVYHPNEWSKVLLHLPSLYYESESVVFLSCQDKLFIIGKEDYSTSDTKPLHIPFDKLKDIFEELVSTPIVVEVQEWLVSQDDFSNRIATYPISENLDSFYEGSRMFVDEQVEKYVKWFKLAERFKTDAKTAAESFKKANVRRVQLSIIYPLTEIYYYTLVFKPYGRLKFETIAGSTIESKSAGIEPLEDYHEGDAVILRMLLLWRPLLVDVVYGEIPTYFHVYYEELDTQESESGYVWYKTLVLLDVSIL